MFRRASRSGAALIAAGLFAAFLPFAAASSATRAHQTLLLAASTNALLVGVIVWLALRPRQPLVRVELLAFAAFCGAIGTVLAAPFIPDIAAVDRQVLVSRLLGMGGFLGAGVWLVTAGVRRVFPRPNRAMAASAILLVTVGLLLWPSLLLQPSVADHAIGPIELQLRAGYRYWTVGALILVAPFLALATLPGTWFERGWAALAARASAISPRAFQLGITATTLAACTILSVYSFSRRPTTADEIAQLWHARMLLQGRLAMPPDPHPEFFAVDNIIDAPVWMSQFPIGGPAILALGAALDVAWLVNPVLTALLVLATYRLARRAYGEMQARAAAVVVAASPMVLIMGATHMNHTATALLVMVALALLGRWRTDERPGEQGRAAGLLGFAVGAAVMIRPLDGAIAAAVLAVPMLAAARSSRARARSLLFALAMGAIPVAVLLAANWRTTGHALRFGYEMLWGANHSLGLHDDPTGVPHTPWRALLLAVKYAAQVNWIGTAWPVPVLAIIAVGLVAARRAHRWDVLLLSFFAAQLLTYAFYWHDGQFVGPRFLFSAMPALLILAARAPFLVASRLRQGTVWRMAVLIVPVCIGVAWLREMRPYGVQALAAEFRESRTRLKVDPPRERQQRVQDSALVFVQEGASSRLLHRLWGLGLSRPDAARLLATADGCSLADAVAREERAPRGDTVGRLARIEQSVHPFQESPRALRLPDVNFRITDSAHVTPACAREIAHDLRVQNTVAYGAMLLHNRFDSRGRIRGPTVYVMDLGDHNEALRTRFPAEHWRWYRYEVPLRGDAMRPVLVPYDRDR